MARLLRNLDYERALKSDVALFQIVQENWQATKDIEQSSQEEMKGKLRQRYRVDEVFSNTSEFDETVVYYGKNLVDYTAPAFSAASNYIAGDRRVYSGNIYEANTSITASAFDPSEWDFICEDKAFFYALLPASEYDPDTTYAIGDEVWFSNKVFTCAQACKNIDPTNSAFWGTGVTYSFSGHLPDDTDYWIPGDNRNQLIVMYLLDIVLYHLFCTMPAMNIPDIRKERYNGNGPNETGGALGWLKSVARGDTSVDLPVYTPQQGMSMRYGNAASTGEPSPNMMW